MYFYSHSRETRNTHTHTRRYQTGGRSQITAYKETRRRFNKYNIIYYKLTHNTSFFLELTTYIISGCCAFYIHPVRFDQIRFLRRKFWPLHDPQNTYLIKLIMTCWVYSLSAPEDICRFFGFAPILDNTSEKSWGLLFQYTVFSTDFLFFLL